MSDIKLFRTTGAVVTELQGQSVPLEKSLQTLIESHLEVLLGIRYLATEYATGRTHGGRIDTLGIDENGCPCIIEYKRSSNDNVINQGLYYLDWLMDHRGEFELLVLKTFGHEIADGIEWSSPRLLCIAWDFKKFDEHAVQQINRNIELIRYRRFGDDLLLLEMVSAVTAESESSREVVKPAGRTAPQDSTQAKCIDDYISRAAPALVELLESLKTYMVSLGDDVQVKTLKWYIAFKRIKNFATVTVHPQENKLTLLLKVSPEAVELTPGFTRDVRDIGRWGPGELEATIRNREDLERSLPLIDQAYDAT